MSATQRKWGGWIAGAVVLAAALAWYWMGTPGLQPETARTGGSSAEANLPCHKVLKCAAAQAMQDASAACKEPIEQLAVFAPRWTHAAGEPIFTDYAWHDQRQGAIRFFGNRAEFQNGSGGFGTVAYECDWDPAARKVLGVRAKGAGS